MNDFSLPDYLLIAAAASYWTFVLATKAGPFSAFQRLRDVTTLGGLLICPPCLVFWTALVLWLLWQTPAQSIVVISAIAGGAALVGYYSGMWHQ